jgi:hypothetical protein
MRDFIRIPLHIERGRAPIALALAAVREKAQGNTGGYCLVMGTLARNGALLARMPVEMGIYATPEAQAPVHRALYGRATEVLTALYSREMPARAVLDALRPMTVSGPATLWARADGPSWSIAWPLLVIPDAQAMLAVW